MKCFARTQQKLHPKDGPLRLSSIWWISRHWTQTLYVQIYRYQPVQDVIFSSNLVKVFAPQREVGGRKPNIYYA